MAYRIGQATSDETTAAIKDILFFFRDLASCSGFHDGHPTGEFSPWKYLDCERTDGWFDEDDVALLHRGAAVALLAHLVDHWDNAGFVSDQFSGTMRAALEAGRFAHLPAAEEAARNGLVDEALMHRSLVQVRRDLVLRTFASLASD